VFKSLAIFIYCCRHSYWDNASTCMFSSFLSGFVHLVLNVCSEL